MRRITIINTSEWEDEAITIDTRNVVFGAPSNNTDNAHPSPPQTVLLSGQSITFYLGAYNEYDDDVGTCRVNRLIVEATDRHPSGGRGSRPFYSHINKDKQVRPTAKVVWKGIDGSNLLPAEEDGLNTLVKREEDADILNILVERQTKY